MTLPKVLLVFGGLLSLALAIYRAVVLNYFSNTDDMLQYINHCSVIFVFSAISLWCIGYWSYRNSNFDNNIKVIRSNLRMKNLSFIASACCFARLVTATFYLLLRVDYNILTLAYVICELLLWLVLGVFFFLFARERARKAMNEARA